MSFVDYLNPGDIVYARKIFKDSGMLDMKMKGHPHVILFTLNDIAYCLQARSYSEKVYRRNTKRFYLVDAIDGFSHSSMVDLRDIYALTYKDIISYDVKNYIANKRLNGILERLSSFQESFSNPSKLYNLFKEKVMG